MPYIWLFDGGDCDIYKKDTYFFFLHKLPFLKHVKLIVFETKIQVVIYIYIYVDKCTLNN